MPAVLEGPAGAWPRSPPRPGDRDDRER